MTSPLQQEVDRILKRYERGLIDENEALMTLTDRFCTIGGRSIETAEQLAREALAGEQTPAEQPTLTQDAQRDIKPKLEGEYTIEEAEQYLGNLCRQLHRVEVLLNPQLLGLMRGRLEAIIADTEQLIEALDEEAAAAPGKQSRLTQEINRVEAFIEAQRTTKVKAKPETASKTERINALIARLAKGDQTAIAELQRLTR